MTLGGRDWIVSAAQRNAREQANHYTALIRLGLWHLSRNRHPRTVTHLKWLIEVRRRWEQIASLHS